MPVIKIKVKSSGDKKYEVEVDTDSTIEDLKTLISAESDVPAENQRLIYSGKVLKDAETVAFYKIQNDHSIHLVKSSAAKAAASAATGSPATAASSSPAVTSGTSASADSVPTNIAAGQGSFNPLADLTGARYAGYAQLPSASMFGPDGGMGSFPDPEQLETLMSNPMFQEQMNALLRDPQMMDMVISQSPQLRSMSPEARQMLQPMFREILSNPESLRSMMNMSRAFQGGDAASGSAFPAPGSNPTVDNSGSTGASNSAPSNATGSGTGGAANPFANMFGGGMPPFDPSMLGSLGGFGGGQQAPPADNRPPEEKYENQLRQLNEMGFSNFEQNVAALRRSGGNVQGALEFLLSGGF